MKAIRILLVGIGGYGENYIQALLESDNRQRMIGVEIVGIVDPFPERCNLYPAIVAVGIPVYSTLDAFYRQSTAELAVISTPIHLHAEHIRFCLSKGSHILCEKPLCALYRDALRLHEAEKKSGKFVAVGYQLSYSNTVQALKRDIMSGLFGKPRQLKAMLLLPRGEAYYQRNDWAGRIKTTSGNWVLDSPVNNACAHQLHNMLYILGNTIETSVTPVSIIAELYRAYEKIENYDTAALRCVTKDGVELLLYTSLAVKGKKYGPVSHYFFEKATITHEHGEDENFIVQFNNGFVKNYHDLPKADRLQKLWDAIDAIRDGKSIVCGIQAAIPHVLCVNGAQHSMPQIQSFPHRMLAMEGPPGDRKIFVEDIEQILLDCYHQGKLPNELGFSWSRPGKTIVLQDHPLFLETTDPVGELS